MVKGRPPVMTMTGELLQPARVYYDLPKKRRALKIWSKLECMARDPLYSRWVWLYQDEAVGIGLPKASGDLPAEVHPIVIGSCYFPRRGWMHVDVHSHERVLGAIRFFDRHVPRSFMRVTHVAVVNRLMDPASFKIERNHDRYFEGMEETKPPSERFEERADEPLGIGQATALLSQIHEQACQPCPEVELLPALYYEDGVRSIRMALGFRRILATQRWEGNEQATMADVVSMVAEQVTKG